MMYKCCLVHHSRKSTQLCGLAGVRLQLAVFSFLSQQAGFQLNVRICHMPAYIYKYIYMIIYDSRLDEVIIPLKPSRLGVVVKIANKVSKHLYNN